MSLHPEVSFCHKENGQERQLEGEPVMGIQSEVEGETDCNTITYFFLLVPCNLGERDRDDDEM